jgi:hypothetical protein
MLVEQIMTMAMVELHLELISQDLEVNTIIADLELPEMIIG